MLECIVSRFHHTPLPLFLIFSDGVAATVVGRPLLFTHTHTDTKGVKRAYIL